VIGGVVAVAGIISFVSANETGLKDESMTRAFQRLKAAFIGTALFTGQLSDVSAETLVPPTRLGINITSVNWYSGDHAFANLTIGDRWKVASPSGWKPLDDQYLDSNGALTAVPAVGDAVKMLVRPDTGPKGALIQCTFAGSAELTVKGGNVSNISSRPGSLSFRWVNHWHNDSLWIQVHSVRPGSPLHDLDCRKASTNTKDVFDPDFLKNLTGYQVLRFMDWQRANANEPHISWQSRHLASAADYVTRDGVPVELMIKLANTVGADAWFSMPWGADDDYVKHFSEMVRDKLSPDHKVYVELGNEVWNWSFPVARMAAQEGQAQNLSTNGQVAQQRRYAQRAVKMMKIWEATFKGQERRLVRVVSTQNANPHVAEIVFTSPDIPAHVDALATAPYFGGDLMKEGRTNDLDEIFRRLNARVNSALDTALQNKAVAAKYGKSYITYEAGQHVVIPDDVPLEENIQRDPRMHDVYRRYVGEWRKRIGNLLMMFGTAWPIGPGGAWGMVEHVGQSPAEAPKLRAMREELGQPSAN
jgi:hypothetical protein